MTTVAEKSSVTMDAEHRYKIGEARVPSVTQVINAILPGWQADEWYLDRGTAMHHGCRLMDDGQLDWSSVSPVIEGRVRAWQKFRAEFPSEVLASELPLGHGLFQYAGTLDRVLIDADGKLVVADIKSTIAPQVKVQLGAYARLHDDSGRDLRVISRGVAVELKDNGTYRTKWFTKQEVEQGGRIFLAALSIYGFKTKERIA